MYLQLKAGLDALEQLKKTGFKGRTGDPGISGRNVTQKEVEMTVQKFLVQPKDGTSPTAETVASVLMSSGKFWKKLASFAKKGEDGKNADASSVANEVMKMLEDQGLHPAKIEQRIAEVRNHVANYGSAMRGGGDTVVAGSGVTITNTANGNKEISASGSSFTVLTITGTIDDSNVTFTAVSQPALLNINGAFYKTTGGAITWTYLAGTITISSPVGTGGSIFGIS